MSPSILKTPSVAISLILQSMALSSWASRSWGGGEDKVNILRILCAHSCMHIWGGQGGTVTLSNYWTCVSSAWARLTEFGNFLFFSLVQLWICYRIPRYWMGRGELWIFAQRVRKRYSRAPRLVSSGTADDDIIRSFRKICISGSYFFHPTAASAIHKLLHLQTKGVFRQKLQPTEIPASDWLKQVQTKTSPD